MADRTPRTYGADNRNWWLIGNAHGGLSVAYGRTAAEARGEARDGIAEAFESEGLSRSAARRGAQSYRVAVHAGGLTYDEARHARETWDVDEFAGLTSRLSDSPLAADILRRRWLTETGQRLDQWMIDEDRRAQQPGAGRGEAA